MISRFCDYERQLKKICHDKGFPLEVVGYTGKKKEFPIYRIVFNSHHHNPKTICFVGGIHGDEDSGPLAILEFLRRYKHKKNSPKIVILPLANPSGYDKGIHANYARLNLNRHFCEKRLTSDNKIIYNAIKNDDIFFAVVFHEDGEMACSYLYRYIQRPNNDNDIFYDILSRMKKYNSVCMIRKIDRNKVKKGVILNPSSDGSIEERLKIDGVPYVLIPEVPDSISISKRIQINLTVMRRVTAFCHE